MSTLYLLAIKRRQIRWVRFTAYIDVRNAYRILIENFNRRDHFGNLGINSRVVLKCVLRNKLMWLDSTDSGVMTGFFDEP